MILPKMSLLRRALEEYKWKFGVFVLSIGFMVNFLSNKQIVISWQCFSER